MLLGDDFTVHWLSDAAQRFFGDSLGIGTSVIGRVHPDDLHAAVGALDRAVANAGERAGAMVRGGGIDIHVKHQSGRYLMVDASMENCSDDPDVRGLLITLRKMSNRAYLDRAVELLSDEGDISEILRAITSYFSEEMRSVATSVSTRIAGKNIIIGTELTTDEHPLVTWNEGWGPLGPGKLNEPTMHAVADLSMDVAGPALAFGATHVVSLPVIDTSGQVAGAVVAWVPYCPVHVDPPNGSGRFATRLARLAILQERARRSLLHQARHDPLTGLANRSGVDRALDNATDADLPMALLYCDLDRFKAVNDTHGHGVGDEMLQLVAGRITQATRADDIGVRIGGDEFVVICPRIGDPEMARQIAERVRARVESPWLEGPEGVQPQLSIGVAVATSTEELDRILAHADAALYADKDARTGR